MYLTCDVPATAAVDPAIFVAQSNRHSTPPPPSRSSCGGKQRGTQVRSAAGSSLYMTCCRRLRAKNIFRVLAGQVSPSVHVRLVFAGSRETTRVRVCRAEKETTEYQPTLLFFIHMSFSVSSLVVFDDPSRWICE